MIIAILLLVCLFLPNEIPVHFNYQGKADLVVNKYFLLFGTFILYSFYWKFLRKKDQEKK
ncbi:DUF1648 domain-containing protein [Enterococcus crotali]|uniref:DUF1648 domain-containing protein n=1 Tax=Enterococcus crotali TaxID=1453587 RepID=UPI001EF9E8FF|nr:DUF1648 domain-containing protein [Enterococcus crotali]